MRRAGDASHAMPLRRLTVGELLDASIAVLREHARPLLAIAAALVLIEQLILLPLLLLGEAAAGDPVELLVWYLAVTVSFGLEAMILALLAAPAARAAHAAMYGRTLSARELLLHRDNRWAPTLATAFLIGGLAGLGAALCWLPWLAVHGFVGLAVPALVLERIGPGAALARSVRLVSQSRLRALGIRLLGYLAWFLLRYALLVATAGALALLGVAESVFLDAGVHLVANPVAYAALACLDAVLYVETRVRVEGLDLTLALDETRGRGRARLGGAVS